MLFSRAMTQDEGNYYLLDASATDPARIRKEREKARKLRKSQWWQRQLNRGECHYCQRKFPAAKLTMDHVVPLARGGTSTPGNIVPACKECNRDKKLDTPVDQALSALIRQKEKAKRESDGG